jgi:hypothetical protein
VIECPRCQAPNSPGRRFCADCGASLAVVCPACGFSNEPGVQFCGGCGRALASSAMKPGGTRFSPQSYTPKHLAESEALLLAGQAGDARTVAERGLEDARGERRYEAQCLRALGEAEAYGDPPDPQAARTHLQEALALATDLGMRPLVAHCHLAGRLSRGRFFKCCRSLKVPSLGQIPTRRPGASVYAHVESARVQNVGKLLLRRKLHLGSCALRSVRSLRTGTRKCNDRVSVVSTQRHGQVGPWRLLIPDIGTFGRTLCFTLGALMILVAHRTPATLNTP